MALQLRRRGIERVRPLAGGFDAWVEGGRPVQSVAHTGSPGEPGDPAPDRRD